MKRTIIYIFIILALLLGPKTVMAKCSYEEKAALNRDVANVKATYEVMQIQNVEGETCDGKVCENNPMDYFKINILNLNKNYYIKVAEKNTKYNKTFFYSDANDQGIVSFDWENVFILNNFVITVYSSTETNCPNEKLKVVYLNPPRKNYNADYDICKNELSDYYLCAEYVTYAKDPTTIEFREKIEQELEKRKEEQKVEKSSFWTKLINFIKDNLVIIISIVVVIIVSILTIIIIKKRRKL